MTLDTPYDTDLDTDGFLVGSEKCKVRYIFPFLFNFNVKISILFSIYESMKYQK